MTRPAIHRMSETLLSIGGIESTRLTTLLGRLKSQSCWIEIIPGLDSIAVSFDPLKHPTSDVFAQLETAMEALQEKTKDEPLPVHQCNTLNIDVTYGGENGPDLDRVSEQLSLSPDALIAAHSAKPRRVSMMGFTPGFAYVEMPGFATGITRLETPRRHVPAGSVGVIEGFCGLYALDGPGGWPIIGKTDLTLFDADTQPPFKLAAGQQVRFTPAKQ